MNDQDTRQDKLVKAYARFAGYRENERYSPFEMARASNSFIKHGGHGLVRYAGPNNGHLEFRCDCGDAIFVLPA